MQITFWETSTFKGTAHAHFPVQYSCKLIQWKIQCTLQHIAYLQAELYCCHIFSFSSFLLTNWIFFSFSISAVRRQISFKKERASNSESFVASSLRIFFSKALRRGTQKCGMIFPLEFFYSTTTSLQYYRDCLPTLKKAWMTQNRHINFQKAIEKYHGCHYLRPSFCDGVCGFLSSEWSKTLVSKPDQKNPNKPKQNCVER